MRMATGKKQSWQDLLAAEGEVLQGRVSVKREGRNQEGIASVSY